MNRLSLLPPQAARLPLPPCICRLRVFIVGVPLRHAVRNHCPGHCRKRTPASLFMVCTGRVICASNALGHLLLHIGPLVNNVISEADVDMDHCFMSSVRGRIRLSFVRAALRGSDCRLECLFSCEHCSSAACFYEWAD